MLQTGKEVQFQSMFQRGSAQNPEVKHSRAGGRPTSMDTWQPNKDDWSTAYIRFVWEEPNKANWAGEEEENTKERTLKRKKH